MTLKKFVFAALVALLGSLLVATPAQADARNGVCEDGEFCLYYNSNHDGSLVDFTGNVQDYGTGSGCVKFISSGSGRGQCVKNNAASAWNRKSVPVTIFYKSTWSGAIDSFISGKKANLSASLKNENAGHIVGESGNEWMEVGLYHDTGGAISSYFDGYLFTNGRHEGIDFTRGGGSPVFALLSGTVIFKEESGGSGLSTLSIYNASLDVTIIYLHTDPLVGVGASISRGERIATEAARGAQSAHTHVEMRPGRRERAADSTGDPVLDNPVPTSFWMNRGYNICCQ